jgi:hypothetical protein
MSDKRKTIGYLVLGGIVIGGGYLIYKMVEKMTTTPSKEQIKEEAERTKTLAEIEELRTMLIKHPPRYVSGAWGSYQVGLRRWFDFSINFTNTLKKYTSFWAEVNVVYPESEFFPSTIFTPKSDELGGKLILLQEKETRNVRFEVNTGRTVPNGTIVSLIIYDNESKHNYIGHIALATAKWDSSKDEYSLLPISNPIFNIVKEQ